MSEKLEFIDVRLLVIPVYGFTGVKYLYLAGDFAYGQWVIFENDKPRYYLDIFDSMYISVRDQFKGYPALSAKFKRIRSSLAMGRKHFGLRMDSKGKLKKFTLEKLPLSMIEDLV